MRATIATLIIAASITSASAQSPAGFNTQAQVAWAAAAFKCLKAKPETQKCGIIDNGSGGPTMWCPAGVDVDNAIRTECQAAGNAEAHPPMWKPRLASPVTRDRRDYRRVDRW